MDGSTPGLSVDFNALGTSGTFQASAFVVSMFAILMAWSMLHDGLLR